MAIDGSGRGPVRPMDETVASLDLSARGPAGPRVELVEGTGPALSDETHSLLQCRLRAAALTLCIGFVAYSIWELVWQRADLTTRLMQWSVTAVLAVSGFSLCRKCRSPLWMLRIKEALIFGMPAIFLCRVVALELTAYAREFHFLVTPFEPWLMLAFTYAMFIPNTWRRAAVNISLLMGLPVLVTGWLYLTDVACREAINGGWQFMSSQVLMMAIGAMISICGVGLMGNLRSQAFVARQLGQYRLKQLIGAGGMGEVYLGEHRMMKRPCAIKVIRPEKAGDPRLVARFAREVESIAALSHWNTVEIYDYGRTDDGKFYYVMEYLPGRSLQDLVDKFGPMPASRAIYLLHQACDALREAHQLGLVHRDIKPANIFCAERGGRRDVVKLLDFGLAKPVAQRDAVHLSADGGITGSPLYLAPEQATGDSEPDARSDIYSLGAVAFFLVTGRPPFVSDRTARLIVAHVHDEPPSPRQFADDLPEEFEQLVLKCLAKRPEDRFQSAAELAEALDACSDAQRWTYESADRWWELVAGVRAEADPVTV